MTEYITLDSAIVNKLSFSCQVTTSVTGDSGFTPMVEQDATITKIVSLYSVLGLEEI